jgi:hypothetical protein
MANSRHFYKGDQVLEPREWEELQIEMQFANNRSDATIKFDNLTFVGETAIRIIQDLKNTGYYEGKPYRIEVGEQGAPVYVFDGYLDASKNPIIKGGCEIELALGQKQGVDWLRGSAESFSYRYLADPSYTGRGAITASDYRGVPYIINYIPDGMQLLFLAISAFTLSKSLVDSVTSISNQTVDLIEGLTPSVGGNAGGPVTSWSLGKIIGSIITLGIDVIFAVATTVALVLLTEQIIEQLAPKKRIHLGMTLRTLFEKGCEYLGLEFKSTIEELEWVMIPSKGHKGGLPPSNTPVGGWVEVGYPERKDGIDNLADMLKTWGEIAFNADYRIENGVLELERRDFWRNNSSFTLPDTFTNQDNKTNEFELNTDELVGSIEVLWGDDKEDKNTLDDQSGRSFQVITRPKSVNDPDLVNIKGSETISIPASMATRKNKLTAVEEVLKGLLQAVDFLGGQLDSPQSFAAQFSARIGAMHLSSHFLSKPKIVAMSGNLLTENQREVLDARQIWFNYRHIDSFDPLSPNSNQQVTYKEQEIPFCPENFVSLRSNNYVTAPTGEVAEMVSLVWKVKENTATATYRVFRVYDKNLELIYKTI